MIKRYEVRNIAGIFDVQPYGWVVTMYHFGMGDDTGQMGPAQVAPVIEQALRYKLDGSVSKPLEVQTVYWRIYGDDGQLYLSGYLAWPADEEPDDETLYAPLGDYGDPAFGATTIRFHGHPNWDIG